jgi:hypothetical protein
MFWNSSLATDISSRLHIPEEIKLMRKVLLAVATMAIITSMPLASIVKAEDTTVIKKGNDEGDRTKAVIKKDEPGEKRVIIKKNHED